MADECIADWEVISARIHDLWLDRLDNYDLAMRGDLHDIGILVRDEFALGDRKAEQAITRWTAENRPRSLLNAQWQRFRTAMQDRWEPQTPFDPDNRDDLNAARNLVIHDIDELLNRMIEHYRLTERSEEHTSELQSLMSNSYAVLC